MIVGGAGGPGALQTSPPARRQKSVDTNPHAALSGLTCRASPANSSIAGGATLDSVRLRRNRSLLLCGTQSSPLTCARGAYRAWAREKTKSLRDFGSRHRIHVHEQTKLLEKNGPKTAAHLFINVPWEFPLFVSSLNNGYTFSSTPICFR